MVQFLQHFSAVPLESSFHQHQAPTGAGGSVFVVSNFIDYIKYLIIVILVIITTPSERSHRGHWQANRSHVHKKRTTNTSSSVAMKSRSEMTCCGPRVVNMLSGTLAAASAAAPALPHEPSAFLGMNTCRSRG